MSRKSSKANKQLIPYYLNGTLSEREKKAVEEIIRRDENAYIENKAWKQLKFVLSDLPQRDPSPVVWERVSTVIQHEGKYVPFPLRKSFLPGTVLAILISILLWFLIQPGIMLQWSIKQDGMISYRIFRAPLGSTQFELIKEVAAKADQLNYSYLDPAVFPGRNYVYRVEAIPITGIPAYSQVVNGTYREVLPGQAALILSSIISGYGIVFLIQSWKILPRQKTRYKLAI